jgi:hypothetical protein
MFKFTTGGDTTLKIIFLFFLCALFSFNIFGQPETDETGAAQVSVESISLARDDGNGKAGELTTNFTTTDIPIYCVIKLSSTKSVTVKMNLIAVKVAGVKPETKVITVSYKTNGKQNIVNFTGSPEDVWTAGAYRIDIFVDDKAGGSQTFEIQNASKKVPAEKQIQSKPNSKSGVARRARKT